MSVKTNAQKHFHELDNAANPNEELQKLRSDAKNNSSNIESQGMNEAPEMMSIGTSELGEDFVNTSARAEGANQIAPQIIRDMAEDGSLVVATGWDEGMFYDQIAPEHELDKVDAVLESGAKIAWHEDGERKTDIVGDEESLRETTEAIWSSAVEEAAEEGYKIHAQGNEVGTAVYIEAHSAERGDLINTEQAIESEEELDLGEIAETNTDFEILENHNPSGDDVDAIRFSNTEKNRVEFYEKWKNSAPLAGLRLEKEGDDIVAYRDDEDRDITEEEAKEYIEEITPDDTHYTWNNDWNADILPKEVPTKFQGLLALAEKKGVDTAMIYADKSSDFPEDAETLEEYENELRVLCAADKTYDGDDPADTHTEIKMDTTQEAAYTFGALQNRLAE